MTKYEYFEYFVDKLLSLHKHHTNNFSILKINKLLFLMVCANTKPFGNGLLLDVFDNFKAYPLGPVEDEIYQNIKTKSLVKFEIDNKCLFVKSTDPLPYNQDDITEAIDNAIKTLLSYNPNILKLKAWDLVDITHKYSSWNYAFNQYQPGGNYVKMEKMYIENDIKQFK